MKLHLTLAGLALIFPLTIIVAAENDGNTDKLRECMPVVCHYVLLTRSLMIGTYLLEVESQGVYWVDDALNAGLLDEFSGFDFSHTQPTDQQHVFKVYLGGRERIKVKTHKDFVSVLIEQGKFAPIPDTATCLHILWLRKILCT
jgi:hypothetical protein